MNYSDNYFNRKRLYRATALLLATSCYQSVSAWADAGAMLEEVVVTAQKREESLQDVPVAVTALAGSDINSSGIQNAIDLAVRVPGLTSSKTLGWVQPRIRGVGTTANGPGIENPVAVYVDGVYIASAPGSLFTFSDIERIETLKGPQGTLFGRNSTGGLINVITRNPEFDFSGRVSVGYGNYETTTFSTYLTGPLSDNYAASLSAQGRWQDEGFGTNYGTGNDAYIQDKDESVRAKLLYENNATTAVLNLEYSLSDGSPIGHRGRDGVGFLFGPPTPGDEWDVSTTVDSELGFESSGASLRVEQDLGNMSLVSITGFRKSQFDVFWDQDMTPLSAFTVAVGQRDEQFSQELQLQASSDSSVQWVAGVFYFDAESEATEQTATFDGPLVDAEHPLGQIQSPGETTTKSWAGFFQTTAPLTDSTNLTLGARYTEEERTIYGQTSGFLPGGIPVGPLTPLFDDEKTFDAWTWRLAVDQRLTDDTMAYVSYNRGYKSGGFNVLLMSDPPFDPEELDAYELGLKSELLDNRLRLNTSIFYYDYTNVQVPYYNGPNLGIRNGPSAEIYGLDAELTAAVTSNLTLSAGLSILDSQFKEFPDSIITTAVPELGASVVTFGDAEGNKLPYTPDWTTNLAADYAIVMGKGELLFNASYYYNDGFYSESDNLRAQDSYHMINASVRWTSANEAYSVSLWGKNLAEEAVVQQLSGTAFAAHFATYAPPRTYGVSLDINF